MQGNKHWTIPTTIETATNSQTHHLDHNDVNDHNDVAGAAFSGGNRNSDFSNDAWIGHIFVLGQEKRNELQG